MRSAKTNPVLSPDTLFSELPAPGSCLVLLGCLKLGLVLQQALLKQKEMSEQKSENCSKEG